MGMAQPTNSSSPWLDTDGKPIQAHGGGILKVGRTFYWYGENKSQGYFNKVGVSCYSSRDLKKWKNEGVVLRKEDMPADYQDAGVCERPKVIYNKKTKKYVLWAHLDGKGYSLSEAGVAIADKPTGPFKMVSHSRPIPSSTFRDMNLFQDDDGRAYVLYAGEGNATLHIMRLNAEHTAVETPLVEGQNWTRAFVKEWREAPAPFKFKGKYYLISSQCTGWAPNEAGYAVADHILGPWKTMGNPCSGPLANKTFMGQSTFVLPLSKGRFLFMADQWKSKDLADSRYLWLPIQMKTDGAIEIPWVESFDLRP